MAPSGQILRAGPAEGALVRDKGLFIPYLQGPERASRETGLTAGTFFQVNQGFHSPIVSIRELLSPRKQFEDLEVVQNLGNLLLRGPLNPDPLF